MAKSQKLHTPKLGAMTNILTGKRNFVKGGKVLSEEEIKKLKKRFK